MTEILQGLILDKDNGYEPVAYPYKKFFNHNEPQGRAIAEVLDWDTVTVYEKLDGQLCTVYFYDNQWHVASSGTFSFSPPAPPKRDTNLIIIRYPRCVRLFMWDDIRGSLLADLGQDGIQKTRKSPLSHHIHIRDVIPSSHHHRCACERQHSAPWCPRYEHFRGTAAPTSCRRVWVAVRQGIRSPSIHGRCPESSDRLKSY